MLLTVKNRLLLSFQILPKKGSITDQLLVQGILRRIELTSDEISEFEVKSDTQTGVAWNAQKTKDIEVEFSPAETNLLKTAVSELDAQKEITFEILDLCVAIKALG